MLPEPDTPGVFGVIVVVELYHVDRFGVLPSAHEKHTPYLYIVWSTLYYSRGAGPPQKVRPMTVISEKGYNGWSNYPTWNIYLWISNDAGLFQWGKAVASSTCSKSEKEDLLKEHFEAEAEGVVEPAGWITDLLTYALNRVNWAKIREALEEASKDE